MNELNWFNIWGHVSDTDTRQIKIDELEILDNSLSYGAFRLKLWIRFLACHDKIALYTKDQLAIDLNTTSSHIGKWLKELDSGNHLPEFDMTWLSNTPCHLYFIRQGTDGPIKIGRAVDIERRIMQLQTGSSQPLQLLAFIHSGGDLEPEIHRRFAHLRLSGEWFSPAKELLEFIGKAINEQINQ